LISQLSEERLYYDFVDQGIPAHLTGFGTAGSVNGDMMMAPEKTDWALKKTPGNNKYYREAVLYACLHDTRYDWQCEDGRDYYLYEAINLIADKTYFEDKIIEKLYKTESLALTGQLSGLLYLFARDGSSQAADALQKRLDQYLVILPRKRTYSFRTSPRESAECIAIWLCELYGIASFLQTIERMGEIMQNHPEPNVFWYDWLFDSAQNMFGEKRVMDRLNHKAKTSPGVRCFLDAVFSDRKSYEEARKHRQDDKITCDDLIQASADNKRFQVRSLARRMARTSTSEEICQAAQRIKNESDTKSKADLLNLFIFVDYPYDLTEILEYYALDDGLLKETTLAVLARFEDKRIHELATENIKSNTFVAESLGLLIKNFNNDYRIILDALKQYKDRDSYNFHSLVMDVKNIFEKRNAKQALDILL